MRYSRSTSAKEWKYTTQNHYYLRQKFATLFYFPSSVVVVGISSYSNRLPFVIFHCDIYLHQLYYYQFVQSNFFTLIIHIWVFFFFTFISQAHLRKPYHSNWWQCTVFTIKFFAQFSLPLHFVCFLCKFHQIKWIGRIKMNFHFRGEKKTFLTSFFHYR